MSRERRSFSRIRNLSERFRDPDVWRMSQTKRPGLATYVLKYDRQLHDSGRMSRAKRSFLKPFLT
eukprot:5422302-Pyramimonas_sp.AAC.1